MIKKNIQFLILTAALLGISSSALAITFGIKGNYGMPSSSMIAMTESPTNTFKYTFTASGTGNNYVKFYKNQQDGNSTCVTTSASVNPVTYGTEYSCTVGSYKEFQMSITSGTTYTCTVVYTSDSNVKVTFTSGCSATKPSVTTSAASSITTTTATLGGNVTAAGQTASCTAQTVSGRGIEWVSGTGKTAGTKESSGSGTGSFTVNTTGLTPGVTYTYKAYATNSAGTQYGSNQSFTTASASVPTVRIGSQITEDASYNVSVGGYVAATGCSNISKFTIYYSKSTIASKSGSGVFTKEISVSSPGIGSNTPLTLPASEIATHNWGNANMYVRITATNDVGESELSDEVVLAYTLCEGVITELTISPASKAVEINKAQTFSYTANTGAVVNSVKWYKNDAEVGTGSTYTFTPTTTSDFTIGLKAVNTSCNPAPGFAAETQTYTVCSPITGVTINNCPLEQAVGEEITLHATITGATSADSWVWRVNDAAQEVTVDGTSASITFTPREAKEYESVLTVTDCVGQEHVTSCTFNAAAHFTANNITGKSFTACKDNHQFKFSEMFSPLPDSWSVVVKNTTTDAKSLFSLDENGNMVWNPSGKSSGTYSYVFTGVKSGYTNATAELSFTFTANAPSATLSNITITSGSTPTYPYTKVELHCDVASGSASDIGWSVNNGGLVVRTSKGYAYFKGKAVKTATTYTVSAVGLSETCGATAAKTINIVVNPEPTESCD